MKNQAIVGVVTVPNPKCDDQRRAIKELNSLDGGFSFQEFLIKSDTGPLGKHAHAHKTETFFIVDGAGIVLTAEVNESGQILEAPKSTNIGVGSVICVPQYIAHTFYLNPDTRMICYSSAPFDEKNPDFIPCPNLIQS